MMAKGLFLFPVSHESITSNITKVEAESSDTPLRVLRPATDSTSTENSVNPDWPSGELRPRLNFLD